MKINCYCDFIYNAGCELMLWADSYKMENGWKSPILLPVEPTGTRPVTTLEILTPIRWEHCGRRLWALHPVFHVLERYRSSLTGKYSDVRDSTSSHWSACARAGEVVAGGADIVHGWIGQSMWLPHLLWSFFIFIPSVLGFRCDQDESVSPTRKWVLLLLYPLEFSLFKPNVGSS